MEKKCFNCGKEIEKKFIFCPYCGKNLKLEEDKRNFGFLGLDDEMDNANLNLDGGLINNILRDLMGGMGNAGNSNPFRKEIRVDVHSLNGKPVIKIGGVGRRQEEVKLTNDMDEERIDKIKKLPKKEAEASVRRLSNKVVYEVHLPGVGSMKDIMINKLENGIEIRAFSDDFSYFKVLPINLPIVNYGFEKNKLILELNLK